MPSPKPADWVGAWRQGRRYVSGGLVEIKADGDKLHVDAGILFPTARDFHNGEFQGDVTLEGSTLSFTDGYDDSGCHVRMQRIGPWLLIEDNGNCGGAGVTFTGLYRRKK